MTDIAPGTNVLIEGRKATVIDEGHEVYIHGGKMPVFIGVTMDDDIHRYVRMVPRGLIVVPEPPKPKYPVGTIIRRVETMNVFTYTKFSDTRWKFVAYDSDYTNDIDESLMPFTWLTPAHYWETILPKEKA